MTCQLILGTARHLLRRLFRGSSHTAPIRWSEPTVFQLFN